MWSSFQKGGTKHYSLLIEIKEGCKNTTFSVHTALNISTTCNFKKGTPKMEDTGRSSLNWKFRKLGSEDHPSSNQLTAVFSSAFTKTYYKARDAPKLRRPQSGTVRFLETLQTPLNNVNVHSDLTLAVPLQWKQSYIDLTHTWPSVVPSLLTCWNCVERQLLPLNFWMNKNSSDISISGSLVVPTHPSSRGTSQCVPMSPSLLILCTTSRRLPAVTVDRWMGKTKHSFV